MKSGDRKEYLSGFIKLVVIIAVISGILGIIGFVSAVAVGAWIAFGIFTIACGQIGRACWSAVGATVLWLIWNTLLVRLIDWPRMPWVGMFGIVVITALTGAFIRAVFGPGTEVEIEVQTVRPQSPRPRQARATGRDVDGPIIDIG